MTSWKHKVIIFTDRHSNIINQSNDDDNNSEIKVVDITAVEITGAAQTDAACTQTRHKTIAMKTCISLMDQ